MWKLAIAISLGLGSYMQASAATMSFEGYAPTGASLSAAPFYVESGLRISGPSQTVIDSASTLDMVGNDSDFLVFDPTGRLGGVTLRSESGAPFSLIDLLVGPSTHPLPVVPATFMIQGNKFGGGIVSATFSNLTTSTLATLNWENLGSVIIAANPTSIMVAIDEINAVVVPEPAITSLAITSVVFLVYRRHYCRRGG